MMDRHVFPLEDNGERWHSRGNSFIVREVADILDDLTSRASSLMIKGSLGLEFAKRYRDSRAD